MTIHEAECVALKRRGADYVTQLLLGKSRQEEFEFWRKRTEQLQSHNANPNASLQTKSRITRR